MVNGLNFSQAKNLVGIKWEIPPMGNDGKICTILGEMVKNDEKWYFDKILMNHVNHCN